jgi:hypothetical protein
MELVRFLAMIVRIAIFLALIGELKTCTPELMGLAAQKSERGVMSYSAYTRALTRPSGK